MLSEVSAISGKPYPKRLVLKVAGLSSAAWYDIRHCLLPEERQRPGPKPKHSDAELLAAIRDLLQAPDFKEEGYIKLRKRLKIKGIRVGHTRLYRIMFEHGLLIQKRSTVGGGRSHDGRIITDHPNQMWASDGKEFRTNRDGKLWFIGVIDHFNDEIIAFHITKKFDRFSALEPLRAAVKKVYGSVEQNICEGMDIALRSDNGSQFTSKDYLKELEFLGIEHSLAFIRSPECNGIIERFHRTLNEQVFIETFEDIEEAVQKTELFIEKYNNNWLLHRLKLTSPLQYRRNYESMRSH